MSRDVIYVRPAPKAGFIIWSFVALYYVGVILPLMMVWYFMKFTMIGLVWAAAQIGVLLEQRKAAKPGGGMSKQRVNRRSEVQWPLLADADRHEDLVRALLEPCLDYGPLDEELELALERSLMDPGNDEPGPLVQELLGSLLDPRNGHEPLVGKSGDRKLRLVDLRCATSFVGSVWSYEVGDRLPDHLPYYVFAGQIPDTATETEGTLLPGHRWCRVPLNDADDPWLRRWMDLHQVNPPNELATYCRDHGALTFTRRQALDWAKLARQNILDAEERGETPKVTRRKLRPPIVSAVQ